MDCPAPQPRGNPRRTPQERLAPQQLRGPGTALQLDRRRSRFQGQPLRGRALTSHKPGKKPNTTKVCVCACLRTVIACLSVCMPACLPARLPVCSSDKWARTQADTRHACRTIYAQRDSAADRHTYRQTYMQTDGPNRHTSRQAGKQASKQAGRQASRQAGKLAGRQAS